MEASGAAERAAGKGRLASRASIFKPSPIQALSKLSDSECAINLAEGFPDYPSPEFIKDAGVAAIEADHNQYSCVDALNEAIAARFKEAQGIDVSPQDNVVVCVGQTEAMAAAVMAVVDPGDEVVMFEPVFETYPACVRLAGGVPSCVALFPPSWAWDPSELRAAFSPKTKAVIVNSPHNPTGRVWTRAELEEVAALCQEFDVIAITDEVYEEFTYHGAEHVSMAAIKGMRERTVVTSSLSKTFSVTGWRIGWAIAPPDIAAAISAIKVKFTDSAPAPFQHAAVVALNGCGAGFYEEQRLEYAMRREATMSMLKNFGFGVAEGPEGAFYVFAELPAWAGGDDVAFVENLIKTAGVAMVPGSVFFTGSGEPGASFGRRFVRVAFCKKLTTLGAAAKALEAVARG